MAATFESVQCIARIISDVFQQEHVWIHGKEVNRIRLQAAKLNSDPCKCAQQLMSCLFSVEEMVNGNPSGVTKSKDPTRNRTIKRLDPNRMKYITGKQDETIYYITDV